MVNILDKWGLKGNPDMPMSHTYLVNVMQQKALLHLLYQIVKVYKHCRLLVYYKRWSETMGILKEMLRDYSRLQELVRVLCLLQEMVRHALGNASTFVVPKNSYFCYISQQDTLWGKKIRNGQLRNT